MRQSLYLTARQAAAELGVKLPTLYAYVSRGVIRSESGGAGKRERRYHAEDVQRLKERQELRRDPSRAVAGALHWGAPVLDSALTLISDGKLYFRGHNARALASNSAVEEVAALLWQGDRSERIRTLSEPVMRNSRGRIQQWIAQARQLPLIESFQMVLLMAAAEDSAAYDLRPNAVAETGGWILRLMASVAANRMGNESIAQMLARSWMPRQELKATRLLNTALILMADHELNVSSFTARCVASAGATPYEVVTAGLAALQGVKHGGMINRVEALFDEIQNPRNARIVLSRRLKRGDEIPGFGHKLYPEGDPRARLLLQKMAEHMPRSPALAFSNVVIREARTLIGEEPNTDFALAILARQMGLPEGYGMGLFALSRTIGWVAHAIEQYQSNRLIRPRARYIGRLPERNDRSK